MCDVDGRPGTRLYLWTAGTNGWHALFCDWGTSAVMRFIKRSCLAFIKPYHPTMWLDANAKFKFHPLTVVEGSGNRTTKTVRKFEGGKQFCPVETCRTCNLTFESCLFFFFYQLLCTESKILFILLQKTLWTLLLHVFSTVNSFVTFSFSNENSEGLGCKLASIW